MLKRYRIVLQWTTFSTPEPRKDKVFKRWVAFLLLNAFCVNGMLGVDRRVYPNTANRVIFRVAPQQHVRQNAVTRNLLYSAVANIAPLL